jgi:lysyl-tRNA synthetase class 2
MDKAANLFLRAKICALVREFFSLQGFLEVNTPLRTPAPLPEAHIDLFASEGAYLAASPEALMKRLLAQGSAQGLEKIFFISPAFRKGERGVRHLPEFTLLEWYRADADYTCLMEECEALFLFVAKGLGRGSDIVYQGKNINLTGPWPRISVNDAFLKYAKISLNQALSQTQAQTHDQGVFDETMAFEVEPNLPTESPVFLMDFPIEKASLARPKPQNSAFAERFELYAGGMELANAFSELTDPAIQKARFAQEEKIRQQAGKPPLPMPEKFLDALKNLPPCAGIALGFDRLVMLFADAAEIDQVVSFTPEEL